MGKTRDLFKKIRDTKGIFHAKMSTIKDKNCMDLAEAEDIKKRWQEYTKELTKKIFMTQITICLFAFLFLGDGLDHCLLFNATNLLHSSSVTLSHLIP